MSAAFADSTITDETVNRSIISTIGIIGSQFSLSGLSENFFATFKQQASEARHHESSNAPRA